MTTADLDAQLKSRPAAPAPASSAESASLALSFRQRSPRLNPKPATFAGVALYAAIVALWLAAMVKALFGNGLVAWSVGVVYIAYDVVLLAFVAWHARAIWREEARTPDATTRRPSLGVIIAAYNEAPALAATIDALINQTDPPDAIWLADDGSHDGSDAVLAERYGLAPPARGSLSPPSPVAPMLRWLNSSIVARRMR